MIPLRVAIFHRGDWYRYARVDGQFAYPVPEFTWTQHKLSKEGPIDLRHIDVDIIWLDEGKYKDRILFTPSKGQRKIPIVYHSLYATLDDQIYESRIQRALKTADLVLLDHDDIGRWERDTGLPVRRLAYSVDERYYCDRGVARDIDVGFYCVYAFNSERPALGEWLEGYCKQRGYVYLSTHGENVGTKYADLLARTKVVVHINRTQRTRPPRIFDTAACRTAFLGNPLPEVSGEHWEPWVHYVPFNRPYSKVYTPFTKWGRLTDKDCKEIATGLQWLLDEGHWKHIAERAHSYVLSCHTWAQRAKELRRILLDVFPDLREGVGDKWMYQSSD